ncbi:transmembrane protein 245-like [Homarus americanus]|uniref:transmembrane protein 245-like n=1 Tax=Homarus americanus TaxID=6706 RepID=UPI001C44B9E0|nr:transmembrane protein 245-like [Homarus americanus]
MSLYGENVRSPLEQVWRQFIPQGYDQALRNAFYNVAAIVFVGCVAAAAWSVYMIFQPFVQPLLWAVLCGSLLHPAKHAFTTWTRAWLSEVQGAHSLLSVSVALLPLRLLDTISEIVGRFVVQHVRSVVTVTVILPVVYIIIHHTPEFLTSLAYTIFSYLFSIIAVLVSTVTTNGYIALALVVGYLGAVLFCWSGKTSDVLTRLSLGVWLIAAAGLSGLWAAGSVPIFLILCLLLAAGLCTEVLDVHAALKASKGEEASLIQSAMLVCVGSQDPPEPTPSLSVTEKAVVEEKSASLTPVAEEETVEDVGEHSSNSQLSTIPEGSPTSSSVEQDAVSLNADTVISQDKDDKQNASDSSGTTQEGVGKEEPTPTINAPQQEGDKQQVSAGDPYCTPMVDTLGLKSSSAPTFRLKPRLPTASRSRHEHLENK